MVWIMSAVEIIFLVIAVAFVVLVVCLCRLICRACKTLKKVNEMIDDLDHQPKDILNQANEISVNLNSKLKRLDPIFRAVENCGTEWECKTALRNERLFCKCCKSKVASEEVEATDFIQLALMGINLWKKIKKGE